MKKKLEAELISIAHRILKLKNRADLDQLQQETLKLYEKISVLRFVEDNFSGAKPTIGYASAQETLEEIYGIEEQPEVKANEVEAKEEIKRSEEKERKETDAKKEEQSAEEPAKADKGESKTDDTKDEKSEGDNNVASDKEDTSEAEKETETDAKPEGDVDPEQEVEEYQASDEEKEHTEERTDEKVEEKEGGDALDKQKTEDVKSDDSATAEDKKEDTGDADGQKQDGQKPAEEPKDKVEVTKPEGERRAMEESAAAVYNKEDKSTIEEEEKAADAEIITIAPDAEAKTEQPKLGFDFAFERTPAPEEPKKEQKEITFEDYHHDYKEPEFVKKSDASSPAKEEPKKEEPAPVRDWRDWEPSQSSAEAAKKEEPKKEEPGREEPKPASRTMNDSMGKSITLGLNDRVAFEKNLFGGSGEDLNRVLSQLNTFDNLDDAHNFIEDLVKPDYNNWEGKEEYAERFMAIVEKKFD
ncbi:MAG: hypothetical protein EOO45_09315 [Flavobacterium sp.]|nr:MAG: hypothetical protein EOO45_09315 [Flavobacterium sp.]